MSVCWHVHGESELPASRVWLSAAEAARLAGMRFAKRRNEFLLGRFTAKRAVASQRGWGGALAELARIEVSNAPDGAPTLQVDGMEALLSLSLTDRAGWCVCALAPPKLAVGCDLECVEPRSAAFVRDYLTPAEQARVSDARPGESREEATNLIWSAKESALKLLRTGLRRDTRSVEVVFGADSDPTGWRPLAVTLAEGPRIPGWWRRLGDFVLSLVTSVETPPPQALRDASVLATAEPSHAWLAAPSILAARDEQRHPTAE